MLWLIEFNRDYRQVAESLLGDVVVVYPLADLTAVPNRTPENPGLEEDSFRTAVDAVCEDLRRLEVEDRRNRFPVAHPVLTLVRLLDRSGGRRDNDFNLIFFVDWIQHQDLSEALDLFKKAIEIEPQFAKAYVFVLTWAAAPA